MSGAGKAVAAGAGAAGAGLLGLLLLAGGMNAVGSSTAGSSCGQPPGAVLPAAQVTGIPGGSVAGYSGPQLAAAAAIMRAAKDKGLDARAQAIGVMTAMGESGLQALTYGDKAGPDSRGYFQQRSSWGPLSVRLDAYGSAGLFYDVLKTVPGWESMSPTAAAHAVQRNADPFYYTRYWAPAGQVVQALAGARVDVGAQAGQPACAPAPGGGAPGAPGDGWTDPDPGAVLSSGFGWRGATSVSPAQLHAGQDLAARCGTPILAAHAGVILRAGPATGFGNAIYEDVGGGVVVIYGHEFDNGVEVTAGQHVQAGQEIGKVGAAGESTGCHDHFQVNVGGTPVDPVPFLASRGVRLGPGSQ